MTGFEINSLTSKTGAGDYDRARGSNTEVTRQIIEDETSNTGFSWEITTKNGVKGVGAGFQKYWKATDNTNYLIKMTVKLPVNTYVVSTANTRPFDVYYIGSHVGTGDWQDIYIHVSTPNVLQGRSRDFGHHYLSGASANCTWYINSFAIYQVADTNSFDYTFGETDVTLTAQWVQKRTKVVFDAEGGTVKAQEWGNYSSYDTNTDTHSLVKVGDISIGCPKLSDETITKEGYTFAGWWTGEGGTGSMLIDASGTLQVVSGYTAAGVSTGGANWIRKGDYSVTLYAKWVASTE